MKLLSSNQNLSNSIVSDYIVRIQYSLSAIYDVYPALMGSLSSGDVLNFIQRTSEFSDQTKNLFKFEPLKQNHPKVSTLSEDIILKIECMMSCYALKDISAESINILSIDDADWYGRIYYFQAATDQSPYNGSRLSNAGFLFSNDILEGLSFDKIYKILLKYGFVFTQVSALSYAHVWNVLHALRARDIFFQKEGIYLPVKLYIDKETSSNYHLIENLKRSHDIHIINALNLNSSVAKMGDHVSLLTAHKILNRYGIRSQIGPVSNSVPSIYIPSRIFLNSSQVNDQQINTSNLISQSHPAKQINVGLHVRDDKYKFQSFHSYRNSNIEVIMQSLIRVLSKFYDSCQLINIWIFGYSSLSFKNISIPSNIHLNINSDVCTKYRDYSEASIYDKLDYLIGTTSGPAHITNALGIPTLFLESTNLYGCDLIDKRSMISLKTIKPSNQWFKISQYNRSLLIKQDWNTGLLNYCSISQTSSLYTEIIIKSFLSKLIKCSNNEIYSIKRAFGEFRYGSSIDDNNIDELSFNRLKYLLR